jgi:hypothetical protein
LTPGKNKNGKKSRFCVKIILHMQYTGENIFVKKEEGTKYVCDLEINIKVDIILRPF